MVDKVATESTAITQKVSIDFLVVAIVNALQSAVPFAWRDVAANAATDADGGGRL